MRFPSSVTSVAAGAGAPTRSAFASAAEKNVPSSPASPSAERPRKIARRLPVHIGSEGMTQPHGHGPVRKQLIPLEVTVHRHLQHRVPLQALSQRYRDTRAEVSDRSRRIGGIGQGSLVGALMRY